MRIVTKDFASTDDKNSPNSINWTKEKMQNERSMMQNFSQHHKHIKTLSISLPVYYWCYNNIRTLLFWMVRSFKMPRFPNTILSRLKSFTRTWGCNISQCHPQEKKSNKILEMWHQSKSLPRKTFCLTTTVCIQYCCLLFILIISSIFSTL